MHIWRCCDWLNLSSVLQSFLVLLIFGQRMLCCGTVVCIGRCLAAPLASTHQKPIAGEDQHTQSTQINKVIWWKWKMCLILQKKLSGLFGRPDTKDHKGASMSLASVARPYKQVSGGEESCCGVVLGTRGEEGKWGSPSPLFQAGGKYLFTERELSLLLPKNCLLEKILPISSKMPAYLSHPNPNPPSSFVLHTHLQTWLQYPTKMEAA